MSRAVEYGFREASLKDRSLFADWLRQPHVSEWWDADGPYDQDFLDDPRVSRWIVEADGRPFAYMQDYTVHGWCDHHFFDLPAGSRGVDQFVGDPNMINRGHGTAFIRQRLQALFEAGVPVIGTDPHPDNARAIAVYTKVGFAASGPAQETRWGPILPMLAKR